MAEAVLHCAAYTVVYRAEDEPDRAMPLDADSVEWGTSRSEVLCRYLSGG